MGRPLLDQKDFDHLSGASHGRCRRNTAVESIAICHLAYFAICVGPLLALSGPRTHLCRMSGTDPQRTNSRRYSMTSSARTRMDCGIVMPSAFAVVRLIASSKIAGCNTGNSEGLAPFRIRAV